MMRSRFLAIVAVVGTIACSDDPVTDPFAPLALKLRLTPDNATLVLGSLSGAGSVTVVASATSLGVPIVTPPGRVFESSNTNVALVDARTGQVIATGVGTADITVRVNDEKGHATIVVVPP
jgi:uncharacterized protein YjdB